MSPGMVIVVVACWAVAVTALVVVLGRVFRARSDRHEVARAMRRPRGDA